MLTWPEIRLISRPWTKCGDTRLGPFSASTSDLALDPRQPADARPDRAAGAKLRRFVHLGQASILKRLAGGIDAIDDEGIDLPLDLVVDALVRVEAIFVIGRLHFAGDRAFLVGRVEFGDRPRAALARDQVFPRGLDIARPTG